MCQINVNQTNGKILLNYEMNNKKTKQKCLFLKQEFIRVKILYTLFISYENKFIVMKPLVFFQILASFVVL